MLNLNNNKLYGSLPPELDGLTALQQLHLAGNRLTGSVPPYLSAFPSLRYADLANNQFVGGWGQGGGGGVVGE